MLMKCFLLPLQKETSLRKEQDDKDSHNLQMRVGCSGCENLEQRAGKW